MSHVPFLAVRPNDQFSSDVKPNGGIDRDTDTTTAALARAMPRAPPASRLPAWVRFPLVCILSLALSTLLYTVTAEFSGYELAAVSREANEEWQVGALLTRKLVELSTAWYAGYDWKDLAGLSILSNLPLYFLLTTFYGIDTVASTFALLIDISAIAVPFALLRPLIHAHEPGQDANQIVAQDRRIFFYVGLLGAAIYSVIIYSSLYTWLPVYLLVHFDGVRNMQKAHDATLPLLLLSFLPTGWATAQFLFTPSIGSRGNPGLTDPDIFPEKTNFDPETATFMETVAFNLGFKGGFTKRAEVLVKRSTVLMTCSVANTFARVLMTIDGTEAWGAAGWAGVWGAAALLTSVAYGFVGNE
ncbi:hypothetical protein LTR53_005467 [Teratosphaeriaceae sp. CCFEE 6253]|nr:hypothetical protein LTR53_005467 [Teratosphaeriaceae sp. CCFEE 6253]